MNTLVYVETSVPSFYFDTRHEPEMKARQHWTMAWWDSPKYGEERVIGLPVIAELEEDPRPNATKPLR